MRKSRAIFLLGIKLWYGNVLQKELILPMKRNILHSSLSVAVLHLDDPSIARTALMKWRRVQSRTIDQIQRASAIAVFALVCGGCASTEKQVQKAARDWCMTIRGSQVIPVYPLTEDIQPGDVFLVQMPIDQQQKLYKKNGFLPLDNALGRLNPEGYKEFYGHSFFSTNGSVVLPRDWIRPLGVGVYTNNNGTNTLSWQAAPRVAFPSYSFSVQNGAGLSLAVPVQGVPVGLSLLASDAASGTIQIQDARTMTEPRRVYMCGILRT
jgi:hypothetical protein